jgi:tetratricopeptide (TPR) repeat protein
MKLARFVSVVALGLAAACAPTYTEGYLNAMAQGQRAFQAGRYEEAAQAFGQAAADARRVKDRDEARFLQARTYQRAERWPEAEKSYKRLMADSPTGPRTERAEFELAQGEIEHGDRERGFRMLHEATRRHPKHGLARHAVTQLRRLAAEKGGGEAAGLAWLDAAAPAFKGTELEQVFAYERARSLDEQDRHAEARDAFVATAKAHPYPFGGLTDDALWRAAEIDEALGRFQEAIDDLRVLLSPREVSTMTGSYERPRFSEAQLRIGRIYRDGLKDRAAARRELHKVYTDHPTSILRDDALWDEARIAHEDSDANGACAAVILLVLNLPTSRYAPCAKTLCPSAPVPESKDKPRECAGYILRQLEERKPSEGSNEPATPG